MEGEPGRRGGLGSHGEKDLATRKKEGGGLKTRWRKMRCSRGAFTWLKKKMTRSNQVWMNWLKEDKKRNGDTQRALAENRGSWTESPGFSQGLLPSRHIYRGISLYWSPFFFILWVHLTTSHDTFTLSFYCTKDWLSLACMLTFLLIFLIVCQAKGIHLCCNFTFLNYVHTDRDSCNRGHPLRDKLMYIHDQ